MPICYEQLPALFILLYMKISNAYRLFFSLANCWLFMSAIKIMEFSRSCKKISRNVLKYGSINAYLNFNLNEKFKYIYFWWTKFKCFERAILPENFNFNSWLWMYYLLKITKTIKISWWKAIIRLYVKE